MSRDICIEMKLDVVGLDTIIVPGCEPTSALTSATLSRFSTCGRAFVKLADALEAIPGSRFEYQLNAGESHGVRRKWFILPAYCPDCPCPAVTDYYRILKELAVEEDDPCPDDFSGCGVLDQGFCPPSDFDSLPIPAVKPYVDEGSTFSGITALLSSPDAFNPNLEDQGLDVPLQL